MLLQSLRKRYLFLTHVVVEFEEAFSVFDRDADGVITTSELGAVMTALGHRPSLQELEAIIQGVDTDRKYIIRVSIFHSM